MPPAPQTAPSRPTAPPAQALGFSDLTEEVVLDRLETTGTVPDWLTGTLIRTGPARWDLADGSVSHWFDGQAVLHRFSFADGAVSYADRLLRGRAGTAYEQTGRLAYREFASDPCRTRFQRVASMFRPDLSDNGAVNVGRLGDRWLAMTETPMAVEFDPRTLETLGVHRRAPDTSLPNAHPHHDDGTGEMLDLRVVLGPRSRYDVVARSADEGERRIGSIPAPRPGYQHSFGLTPGHVVVSESPFVVSPLRLATSGRPFIDNYRWEPERGTRLWAVDRATGETRGPWTAPAMFCFHHVNAFEDDGAIVVDLLAYEDAQAVESLRLDRLRAGGGLALPTLERYVLRDEARDVVPRRLADRPFELPRIDGRHRGRPYDVVFGAGDRSTPGFFGAVTRTAISDGTTVAWEDPDGFAGEPVFVRRPDATAEGDGVLLTVVLEPEHAASSLVVLDATDLTEMARARVPHHVPFGFHGQFARDV
ncbi:carotenoid oxygenase family protein [Patulibacter minatonensis]|uniref:carotenoid oxygenase family protein n=1 Tax=Patulibacter minatonensis TaxID=298163 RepID=UPI000688C500|nr:carotenoid oxygenase family protein [Patulibacter minatonensis]